MKLSLPDLSLRVLQPELMDQPTIAEPDLLAALDGLRRIHSISFTMLQLWREIHQWTKENKVKKIRLLDIASGGGDILVGLGELAKKNEISLEGVGADMNATSCERANILARSKNLCLEFKVQDVFSEETFTDFDIIICTLFLHHLSEPELSKLLQLVGKSGARLFLVNDLKRSSLGYFFASLGSRLLSNSHVVHEDALLSVKSAFTVNEIKIHLEKAGLNSAKTISRWPERFMIKWNNPA